MLSPSISTAYFFSSIIILRFVSAFTSDDVQSCTRHCSDNTDNMFCLNLKILHNRPRPCLRHTRMIQFHHHKQDYYKNRSLSQSFSFLPHCPPELISLFIISYTSLSGTLFFLAIAAALSYSG